MILRTVRMYVGLGNFYSLNVVAKSSTKGWIPPPPALYYYVILYVYYTVV